MQLSLLEHLRGPACRQRSRAVSGDRLERQGASFHLRRCGCGEGIDLSMVALDSACEIVGVELSDSGVRTGVARTRGLARAYVVHADLPARRFRWAAQFPFRHGSRRESSRHGA